MPRKISAEALLATLTRAKRLHESSVKHHRWMINKAIPCIRWTIAADREGQTVTCLDAIELSTSNIRDIDHAIAALEQEKNDE